MFSKTIKIESINKKIEFTNTLKRLNTKRAVLCGLNISTEEILS